MDDEFDITVDEVDEETCWRLVNRAGFGRIGFIHSGEVSVLPVNATVSRHRVLFRTAVGTSLARAGHGSAVVFEADDTDRVTESGWSVVVRGELWDVTERAETESWNERLVQPWAPSSRDIWMMIEPSSITGRRIERRRIFGSAPADPA